MKKFSLKALGATILTLGLILVVTTAPAYAATMTSPSASSSGTIDTSGTNTSPITVTATSVSPVGSGSSTVEFYVVELPSGWTFTRPNSGPNCTFSGLSYSGLTASNGCNFANGTEITFFTSGIPAQSTIQVTFATGFLNVSSSRTFSMRTTTSSSQIVDSATADLTGAPAPAPAPAPSPAEAAALAKTGFEVEGLLFAGALMSLAGISIYSGSVAARRKQS